MDNGDNGLDTGLDNGDNGLDKGLDNGSWESGTMDNGRR